MIYLQHIQPIVKTNMGGGDIHEDVTKLSNK